MASLKVVAEVAASPGAVGDLALEAAEDLPVADSAADSEPSEEDLEVFAAALVLAGSVSLSSDAASDVGSDLDSDLALATHGGATTLIRIFILIPRIPTTGVIPTILTVPTDAARTTAHT